MVDMSLFETDTIVVKS